jgi:hypothetical protein
MQPTINAVCVNFNRAALTATDDYHYTLVRIWLHQARTLEKPRNKLLIIPIA